MQNQWTIEFHRIDLLISDLFDFANSWNCDFQVEASGFTPLLLHISWAKYYLGKSLEGKRETSILWVAKVRLIKFWFLTEVRWAAHHPESTITCMSKLSNVFLMLGEVSEAGWSNIDFWWRWAAHSSPWEHKRRHHHSTAVRQNSKTTKNSWMTKMLGPIIYDGGTI